jgi:hypothetical protein
MGEDAFSSSINQYTAKDAYGLTLNYFTGGYLPINNTVNPFPGYSAYLSGIGAYRHCNLYDLYTIRRSDIRMV